MSLTEESVELMNEILPFLNKIKGNKCFVKNKLTNNTIKDMYNEIRQSEFLIKDLIENNKITQTIDIFENKHKLQFPSLFNSRFVVSYIQNYVKKHNYGTITLNVSLYHHDISVIFYLLNEDDESNYILGKQLILNIFTWLGIAAKNSKKHCAETLKIHCFMSPFKKKLPENDYEILSHEHCNSAVTTSCTKNGEICIFRKEEFLKVLIHESFHIFGLDFSGLPVSRLKKNILKIFPIQIDMELHESYAETWANIMNAFICANNFIKNSDFSKFTKYLDFCIHLEQFFSLFQLIKILNFMNLNYKNLYENDEISVSSRRYLYREKTNVFAYYILKTVFLCNIDLFLDWCKTNNVREGGNIFNFRKTSENIDKFEQLIKSVYNKKCVLENISTVEKIFSNINSSINILKTTRMTLCELN